MTTIYGYEILACPYCKQIHQKVVFGSTNSVMAPHLSRSPSACAGCGKPLTVEEMIKLGLETTSRPKRKSLPSFLQPKNKIKNTWYQFQDFIFGIVYFVKMKIRRRKYSEKNWYEYPSID